MQLRLTSIVLQKYYKLKRRVYHSKEKKTCYSDKVYCIRSYSENYSYKDQRKNFKVVLGGCMAFLKNMNELTTE